MHLAVFGKWGFTCLTQDTPPLGVPIASPGEVTPPLPDEDSVTPPFEAFRGYRFRWIRYSLSSMLIGGSPWATSFRAEAKRGSNKRKGRWWKRNPYKNRMGGVLRYFGCLIDIALFWIAAHVRRDTTPLTWAGAFMNLLSLLDYIFIWLRWADSHVHVAASPCRTLSAYLLYIFIYNRYNNKNYIYIYIHMCMCVDWYNAWFCKY